MRELSIFRQRQVINQYGFTLIELMITLLLGVLISAAVIQVFVTSQRVDRFQASGSEIQDKSVFGIQSLEKHIRYANLGNDGVEIDLFTPKGGIVLKSVSNTVHDNTKLPMNQRFGNVITKNAIDPGYLSRSGEMAVVNGEDRWTGISNMLSGTNSAPSDQLTIQYTNVVDDMQMYDCEGTIININDRVIERYFLSKDADSENINLLCDAGRIVPSEVEADNGALLVQNFGSIGENNNATVIMENIDQFKVRLGVARRTTHSGKALVERGDLTIKQFVDARNANNGGDAPFYITNVRFSVIARSTSNTPKASPNKFVVFGSEQTLNSTSASGKYMRRLYETNVLLRNARVLDL